MPLATILYNYWRICYQTAWQGSPKLRNRADTLRLREFSCSSRSTPTLMNEPTDGFVPDLSRRDWIASVASALGLSVTAATLPMLLSACNTPPSAPSPAQPDRPQPDPRTALVEQLAEMIIPQTDTPGAIETGTPAFVLHFMRICATTQEREKFDRGLAKLEAVAKTQQAGPFTTLTSEARTALLHKLDRGQTPFDAADKAFFSLLKSAVLLGYYTSEAGATQELAFLPVPGAYRGNFPFAQVGKAWSLPG
ncbi:MAG: gluconate 2-dehydrogenase subunit 3 family protein [Rhodanobacteraceae bacterium]|nr:gluconate 2-dehydrogenase subunit 3 family protein [Rhodanobacteraceae bacterium]